MIHPHTIQSITNNTPNTIQQLTGPHVNEQTILLTSPPWYGSQSLHFFTLYFPTFLKCWVDPTIAKKNLKK